MKKFHTIPIPSNQYLFLRKPLAVAVMGALASVMTPVVSAQQEPQIEELVVIGSRGAPRSAIDSAVPVDVFSASDFLDAGSPDLNNLLRDLIPSFNVDEQQINDSNSLVRPATLRGLPADNTLVLVNGKRRHRSAAVQFGNSGTQFADISQIPSIALRQVEVLRDNAGAQYGSDAIAGVINFNMKENRDGLTVELKNGIHSDKGDGELFELRFNKGLPLGDNGFLSISGEAVEQDVTNRRIQRQDAENIRLAGNTDVLPLVMPGGLPDTKRFNVFVNAGIELSPNQEIYGFGNYSERDTELGFFFRNPENTGGIFTRNNDEGQRIQLFMDLSGANDPLNNCPQIRTGVDPVTGVTSSVAARLAGEADPNCFTFLEMFPGGYTPVFGADVIDFAQVLGVRGEFANGTRYDLSGNFGFSEVTYKLFNTTNPSLGPNTPTSFEPGRYTQLENTLNADFVTPVDIGLSAPLQVAYGLEWRRETFRTTSDDPDSFVVGDFALTQSLGIGSNGFPGFGPQQQGSWSQESRAVYLDVELQPISSLLLNVAIRHEDFYNTFGESTDGKFSFRYSINDIFNIRGSVGTGFRAPPPGQANIVNISTGILDGVPVSDGQIPPTNPIARLFGGEVLDPEESESYAFGFTANFPFGLELTLDWYQIEIEDRITNSGSIEITPETAAQIEAAGITGASDLTRFSFFTNDIDSRTRGVDLVASYSYDWNRAGRSTFTLSHGWKDQELTDFTPGILTRSQQLSLEKGTPDNRTIFRYGHRIGDWRFGLSANWFDTEIVTPSNADPSRDHYLHTEWIVDLDAEYTFRDRYSIILGVDNVANTFGERLDVKDIGTSTSNSSKYLQGAFGTEGRFVYARLKAEF